MPISHSVDTRKGVIFEVWSGAIRAEDVGRFWETLLADPEALSIRRSLADVRQARIEFSGDELADLVARVATPGLGGRDWKSAIVVADPVQYGVSRQYQVFAEHFSRDAIFHDVESALAWLVGGE